MFLSVNPAERELEIKRSRFIASAYTIASRDDVKRIIAELWKAHGEARHICYGFIADETGDDFGYDDDGEPNGTAGKPIYSAISAAGARRTLIAVVRYFGGIKLGAGGLTRAYRQSAAELIKHAGLVRTERYGVYDIECDGDVYKKLAAVLRGNGCETERIVYGARVGITVLAPLAENDFYGLLAPLGIVPSKTGERLIALKDGNDND